MLLRPRPPLTLPRLQLADVVCRVVAAEAAVEVVAVAAAEVVAVAQLALWPLLPCMWLPLRSLPPVLVL